MFLWPQLQIGLSESRKPCLNSCSRRWLRPSLSLVSNLIPLGLWQLKTLFPEERINFKSFFLKINKFSELRVFWSSLFHSITTEGKNEFWKKLCFTLNWGILLWSHKSRNNIEQILWRLVSEYFIKAAQFLVPSSFFKGFRT